MRSGSSSWTPAEGDLVWIDFDPIVGSEQGGRRPALILSPEAYNRLTGLAVACPVTTRIKGYPFEVPLHSRCSLQGVIMVDHLRSLSWTGRKASFVEVVHDEVYAEVRAKLQAFLAF